MTDQSSKGYRRSRILAKWLSISSPIVVLMKVFTLFKTEKNLSLAAVVTGKIGPEKGVIQLATAAILNAVWDLWAKSEGKDPKKLVSCIDFRYITDVLTEEDALALYKGTGGWLDKMIDANQRWDVQEAIEWVSKLAEFKPLWIEEPTSPDDILGHATIARCHNRVMFKQMLQAKALQFVQIDSCRLGSVNENLSVLLMASKFQVPVCPHAGGVGLCELVQHLILFDYIAVSGSLENRSVTEYTHS
ncbi:Mitochondrial enolase superfamily member 1 [Acipenser ruthenus]|uniref:Mitochondrial enolase superfamily member 1 n=1 Tax=Acipenser ruthenus TaxID=7906 RepID=A0A444UPX1_ACIRT|nr:Mitochondrial enolase superfamily member 1 [Acipenser ruthenus]